MALSSRPAPLRSVLAPCAALAAVAVLAGCGGDGGSGGGTSDQAKALDGAVTFARCMRKHGVDVPDPGPNGAVRIARRAGVGPDDKDFEAAQSACQRYLGQGRGKPDPQKEAQLRDRLVAYASCMRKHGVDMPDPKVDEHGGVRMLALPTVRASSAAASSGAKANEACRSLMPGPDGPSGTAAGADAGATSAPSLDSRPVEPVQ